MMKRNVEIHFLIFKGSFSAWAADGDYTYIPLFPEKIMGGDIDGAAGVLHLYIVFDTLFARRLKYCLIVLYIPLS